MTTVKIIAKLTDVDGNPLYNKPIEFYKSYDKSSWNLLDTIYTDTNGVSEITDEVNRYGVIYYKARFSGDDTYDSSEAIGYFINTPDYSGLVILCFMMETVKGMRRPREGEQAYTPDYGKCINIMITNVLIKKLYESQAK